MMETRLFRPTGAGSPRSASPAATTAPGTRCEPGHGLLPWLRHSAAALGLERVDGHWTLPAVASYFEDPPDEAH